MSEIYVKGDNLYIVIPLLEIITRTDKPPGDRRVTEDGNGRMTNEKESRSVVNENP